MNTSRINSWRMFVSGFFVTAILAIPSSAQDYKTALKDLSPEEIEAIRAAAPYAKLSDDVYHSAPDPQSIPDGWKPIPKSDDRANIPAFVVPGSKTIPGTVANSTPAFVGTERNVPENPDPIGFHARAYKNDKEKTVAIVFEGTDGLLDSKDMTANLQQLDGQIPEQYKAAVAYAEKVIANNPGKKIVFTGHSLGGGPCYLLILQDCRQARPTFGSTRDFQCGRTY